MGKYGGRKVTQLLRLTLATYGNVCHICGQPIDLTRKWPDPLSATRDHLIPRSRGGSDALDNVRPAHLRCNSSRQARPVSRLSGRADERPFFDRA
ncbi:HNH endonuclease [Schaalia hyovaginalis]|uniref:HNH endonuclease n=1 Tax=Schaalia hyovaginalis TaxID=29316 RepID=UPI00350E3904